MYRVDFTLVIEGLIVTVLTANTRNYATDKCMGWMYFPLINGWIVLDKYITIICIVHKLRTPQKHTNRKVLQ